MADDGYQTHLVSLLTDHGQSHQMPLLGQNTGKFVEENQEETSFTWILKAMVGPV